jgi:hypothetical protein
MGATEYLICEIIRGFSDTSQPVTARQITREKQARPGALNHQPGHELGLLPGPGAVLLFSGAQLHASIRNSCHFN